MKSPLLIVLPLMVGLCAAPLPGRAADAGPAHRSVLEDVTALAEPVTYTETEIPLGELVAKVAAETGVTLTASAEVADEPVAVVVKGLPARELLEQLGDLLDYQWHRRPEHRPPNTEDRTPAFEIWQDLAAKRREAALREAELDAAVQQLQEGVARLVRMADLPPEQIDAIAKEEEQHARELAALPHDQQSAAIDSPQEQARRRERAPAAYLWSPVSRAIARLLGRLTPKEWALLVHGRPLVLSTQAGPGELALPEETAQAFRKAALRYRPSWLPPPPPLPGVDPDLMGRNEQKAQAAWTQASGYQVEISVDLNAETPDSYGLVAYVTPLQEDGPDASFWPGGAGYVEVEADGVGPYAHRPAEERHAGPEWEQDPVFGVKRRFQPEVRPHASRGEWAPPGGIRYLEELLPDVARSYGVDLIADSYWDSITTPGTESPGEPIPLYELLDRLARRDHHWDRVRTKGGAGSLVRLRRRDWCFARPREVPLRFVRRWQALCDRDGALPLSEQFAAARQLSAEQWSSLRFVGYQAGLPDGFLGSQAALQLLAALSSAQLQALRDGKPLLMVDMTAAQRALYLTRFEQAQWYMLRRRLTPYRPPGERAAGLSMTQEPRLETQERLGSSTAGPTGPAAAPAAPPTRVAALGAPARARPTAARASGIGGAPPATAQHRVTRMELHFDYSPELRFVEAITIPSPS